MNQCQHLEIIQNVRNDLMAENVVIIQVYGRYLFLAVEYRDCSIGRRFESSSEKASLVKPVSVQIQP